MLSSISILNKDEIDTKKYSKIISQELTLNFGNFGDILYNRRIPIKLFIQEDGCKPFNIDNKPGVFYILYKNKDSTCQLSERTKNAQNVGAKGVIYQDENQTYDIEKYALIDPDNDTSIIIPSAIIDKIYAEQIILMMQEYKFKQLNAIVKFNELTKTALVEQKMIFNPFDKKSKEFFQSWLPVYNLIKKDSVFVPYFFTQYLRDSAETGFKYNPDHSACISGGEFCGMSDIKSMTGQNAVIEIIKMECFMKTSVLDSSFNKKSLMYLLSYFYEKCWDKQQNKCMDNQQQSAGVLNEINSCLSSSFETEDWQTSPNTVLKGNRKKNLDQQVQQYPAVVVNGVQAKGSLSKVTLFNEICQSFISRPDQCDAIIEDENPDNWNVDIETGEFHFDFDDIPLSFKNEEDYLSKLKHLRNWKLVLVVIISVVCVSIIGLMMQQVMFQCCLKKLLNDKINDNLNKYIEFKDDDNEGYNLDNWND